MPDLRAAGMNACRSWRDLSWRRLVLAIVIAPLPAIYIGFAGFFLANSEKNLARMFQWLLPDTLLYIWSFVAVFTLLYLNTISRLRKRIGLVECLIAGGIAAFLLPEAFFVAVELDVMGFIPTIIFFPGALMMSHGHPLQAGALIGLVLTPAGALSGWIFWHLGVAPAKTPE